MFSEVAIFNIWIKVTSSIHTMNLEMKGFENEKKIENLG